MLVDLAAEVTTVDFGDIHFDRRAYLDDCREAYTVPNDADPSAHPHGVKEWALDPDAARELWAVSLKTLGL